jgi:hypothetical protein
MNRLIYILFILISFYGKTQILLDFEKSWLNFDEENHSTFKKISYSNKDSIHLKSNEKKIEIEALPEFLTANQSNQFNRFDIKTGLAFLIHSKFSQKITFNSIYRVGYTNTTFTSYQSPLQSKTFIFHNLNGNSIIYHDIRGRISFEPNKIFTFETGIDPVFIGEGDRSMFQGNQGIPSPFASIKAKFWKFEYHLVQQIWRELRGNVFYPKGNVMHYLSFKPTKKWEIGFYETVVYKMKDVPYNRNFEVEYLNPLILFRPVEYNIGSSDNILLGIQSSYKWKKQMIYGQFILDEFLLGELRARSRAYVNKFGVQIGYKSWKETEKYDIFFRSELNLSRPFNYSHLHPDVVYGNQSMPVAHPLGSNFVEFYQEFGLHYKDWKIHLWLQYYLRGSDFENSTVAYGGDIYQSYLNYSQYYDNYIGQGHKHNVLQIGTHFILPVIKSNKVNPFIEPRIIYTSSNLGKTTNTFITLGIQSPIGADKRNY